MTDQPDDDFAFLFADEFKPDYSHMLENAKSHKADVPMEEFSPAKDAEYERDPLLEETD
jgi:hypothetical protein